jgi:phosphoglycerate dehydrogenase-like enzyme
MIKMKIAVPNNAFSSNETLVAELREEFTEVIINTEGKRLGGDELIDFIGGADAVIVGLEDYNRDVIDACPSVKVVAKYGVGLDNVDIAYCREKGVEIGWQAGVNKLSVAEMAIGYMLMLSRNLYLTSNQLKRNVWNKIGGSNLSGKTIGIIGVGHIGKELIRLLQPFKCRILVNDVIDQTDYYASVGVEKAEKEKIYREADVITLHTPLTSETRNLIDEDALALMKSQAIVLNTARGELVDLNALKIALKSKKIAGAAIDVYHQEPPDDSALIEIENLINTPHIGGNSIESVLAMGRSAINSLVAHKNRNDK